MILIDEKIESTYEAVHDLVMFILKEIRALGIDEIDDISFGINIMLREVLNNAAEHGNEFHDEKSVHCKIEYTGNNLIFHVTDEGSGFSINTVMDETSDEIIKKRSRGIELIEKYNFKYEFKDSTAIITYSIKKGWNNGTKKR